MLFLERTYSSQPESTVLSVDSFKLIDSIGGDEFELVLCVNLLYFYIGNVECFCEKKGRFLWISVPYFGAILEYFKDSV